MQEILWVWLASVVGAALLLQCSKQKAKKPQTTPSGAGSKNASQGSTSSTVKPVEKGSKMDSPAVKKAASAEKPNKNKSQAKPIETDFNSHKKKMIEEKLKKEKQEKIEKGFFQSKSDEDDTLEKVESCKLEKTDDGPSSRRKSSKKGKK
uniref:Uncharacterized protein n=1 Tax=Bursaphelenchus xylophilus TaxID=6326 RepID=A0A1I7RLZ0_BURXY